MMDNITNFKSLKRYYKIKEHGRNRSGKLDYNDPNKYSTRGEVVEFIQKEKDINVYYEVQEYDLDKEIQPINYEFIYWDLKLKYQKGAS